MSQNQSVIMSLRLIAAQAEKLAADLASNKLWPGQLSDGLKVIRQSLSDAENAAQNDR